MFLQGSVHVECMELDWNEKLGFRLLRATRVSIAKLGLTCIGAQQANDAYPFDLEATEQLREVRRRLRGRVGLDDVLDERAKGAHLRVPTDRSGAAAPRRREMAAAACED